MRAEKMRVEKMEKQENLITTYYDDIKRVRFSSN